MLSRRQALKRTAQVSAALALPAFARAGQAAQTGIEVNDVQSQLNRTRVHRIVTPKSLDAIQAALRQASRDGRAVSVAGGRHAMGGQQFGADTILIDMKPFNRVVRFDRAKGQIEVDAGIEWPALIAYLEREQAGQAKPWAIRQKQTGVDEVTIGGSLAANIHGRGLRFPPFISDIESFVLVDAAGKAHTCSRRENGELFALAIGGYGLFGVVAHVTLRLVPRTKLERIVQVIAVKEFLSGVERRIKEGFVYGDCQYSTDLNSDAAAHPGVFSCYRTVPAERPIPAAQKQLSRKEWTELYRLARTNKRKAFEVYSRYYLSTSGQIYWSDSSQLAGTLDYYHEGLKLLPPEQKGTEMITEVYVRRDDLVPFLADVRRDFIQHKVDPTYGTIRLIEKDGESFLAWAREQYVCIVCNLHVVHTEAGRKKAIDDFRRIIERAIEHRGRFFLTYHRWATRKQVETCYPQFVDFLRLKRKYDPQERFQSEWYRHYRQMFADRL
jgi:FAD/FMN-containing dehydrogenase